LEIIMADTPLQAESIRENTNARKDAFLEAHAAWRHAKAAEHLALYAPDMVHDDLPAEEGLRLSNAHGEAFNRFMGTPAATWNGFIWKLRAFREEDAHELDGAGQLIAALLSDAERLHLEARRGE
jgi:hypothetical protein